MNELSPAVATYIQESRDILEGLESALLDIETNPTPDLVDAVFRGLHTLKGGGGMFGFRTMAGFIHHFEDAFDQVRDGKIGVSPALVDVALRARDQISTMLGLGGDGPQTDELAASASTKSLLTALAAAINASASVAAVVAAETRFQITFRPTAEALRNGMRPDLLMAELAEMGAVVVKVGAADVPPLGQLDPSQSYLTWTVELITQKTLGNIESVFIFADDAELSIKALLEQSPETAATRPAEHAAIATPQNQKTETPRGDTSGDSVRVSSGKLDQILDQLGELVIAQARLGQISSQLHAPELETLVEDVERLVTSLRDSTLSVRMLPIEMVFGKFRRVVRDLSAELGKDVVLETVGGETEIDKNVLDRLSEPLVHMIRNSIDHGIESAEGRQSVGKPAQGRLRLSARQETGEIWISIQDDGKGLNAQAIRRKAIERGLLDANDVVPDSELHQLIFAPGFSTAEAVTSVSGRGVGMDAVLSTVTALRGSVEVQSRPGLGTSVTLRLPLTLAIIDGLLVRLGGSNYVIPLSSVEECVEFDATEKARESGRTMLQIREHLVPFLDLADVFNQPSSQELRRRVIIVKSGGARVGLVVDDILGQHQTVIKPLGPYHAGVSGFSGATILGDGSVALIADVAILARSATHNTASPVRAA
jgi:two-component system chemotaxis sensor kinase CheA